MNVGYFKSTFKKLVMITLQETIALSGDSREECPGLSSTTAEVGVDSRHVRQRGALARAGSNGFSLRQ